MAVARRAREDRRLAAAPGLAFWREAFVGLDWVSLRTSGVYYGFGVPRGDGSPVVVIPGFLGSDRYLMELYYWLTRLGYKPYYSGIGRNSECPDILRKRLIETIDRVYEETGKKVSLIGHSLGGTIARVAAQARPKKVARVITLGSPISAARVHPTVLAAAEFVRGNIRRSSKTRPPECYTDVCNCAFVAGAGEPPPPPVERLAVYTKGDGVVHWRSCLDDDESKNVEVRGTHAGLAFNPEVYRVIARALAGEAPRPN